MKQVKKDAHLHRTRFEKIDNLRTNAADAEAQERRREQRYRYEDLMAQRREEVRFCGVSGGLWWIWRCWGGGCIHSPWTDVGPESCLCYSCREWGTTVA